MSQIVLHRSGTDPDFSYRKRLDVDFSHLLGVCVCVWVTFSYLCSNGGALVSLMFVCLCFSEVCVDKARADEYEQRALELEQKVSDFFFFFFWSPDSVTLSLSLLCSSVLFF